MARYLLDTSAFSALMREDSGVLSLLAGLTPDDRLSICTVVAGEILYGLERLHEGKRRRSLAEKARRLFESMPCDPMGEELAAPYARLKRKAERVGAWYTNDVPPGGRRE